MVNKIILKNSAVPSAVPNQSQLDLGELAVNTFDGIVYLKKDTGDSNGPVIISIGEIGSGVNLIDDLADVIITSPQTDETLFYSSGNWRNDTITVSKLDVTGTANSTSFLRGDGSWTIVPIIDTLEDISDVVLDSNFGPGQIIRWSGSQWENADLPIIGYFTDTFEGDGSTTEFTPSETVHSIDATHVFIDGVYQQKLNYTFDSNGDLSFTTAPADGAGIELSYVSSSDVGLTVSSNKSLTLPIKTVTTNAILGVLDYTVECDSTSGPITATLPNAATSKGRIYNIIKADNTGNSITIDGDGSNINGTGTKTLTTQYEKITIQSNGTNWVVL